MTAAQIVTINALNSTYSIGDGHYKIIKETASYGRAIIAMIGRFDQTKEYFSTSGDWGCDFNQDDWWTFFKGSRDNNCDVVFTNSILPSLEKSPSLKHMLDTGIQVLDIGCGTGIFTIAFAKKFPDSHFDGLDNSDKAMKLTKDRSARENISNIRFINGDAHNLPHRMTGQYDLILMFDALHNLPDPYKALEEAKRVLKPHGKIMIYDHRLHSQHSDNVGDMTAALGYTFSTFFCLPCSLSGDSKVGYGGGWGEEEMLKAIGTYFTFEQKYEFEKLLGLYIYLN